MARAPFRLRWRTGPDSTFSSASGSTDIRTRQVLKIARYRQPVEEIVADVNRLNVCTPHAGPCRLARDNAADAFRFRRRCRLTSLSPIADDCTYQRQGGDGRGVGAEDAWAEREPHRAGPLHHGGALGFIESTFRADQHGQ